jgi:hypothetical protein
MRHLVVCEVDIWMQFVIKGHEPYKKWICRFANTHQDVCPFVLQRYTRDDNEWWISYFLLSHAPCKLNLYQTWRNNYTVFLTNNIKSEGEIMPKQGLVELTWGCWHGNHPK